MKTYEDKVLELIKPLFDDFGYEIEEATGEQLKKFEEIALKNKVPIKVILELKLFYKVANGIPCLEVGIHTSSDPLIYEFWEQKKQLWIGQRDMDMISWKEGKFHLGDAGDLNYGEEYVFDNLLSLLKKGFNDWFPGTIGNYPNGNKK